MSQENLPLFVYDPNLRTYLTPYRLKLDKPKIANLLRFSGVSSHNVGKTTVVLYHALPPHADQDDYGAYNRQTKTISIYLGQFWDEYKRCLALATEIVRENKEVDPEEFDYLLLGDTERLVTYLRQAPKPRALIFINKLLLTAINKELDSTLIHESFHAGKNNWYNFMLNTEKRAEAYEQRNIASQRWRGMIILSPR